MSALIIQLATKQARRLLRKFDRDRPRSNALVNFLSPAQEVEIYCTVDEMEDFEGASSPPISLTSDVLDDHEDFRKLLEFLATDYEVRVITARLR